ncbi:hypothetical protein AB0B85_12430 [Micromonospora sp. NPDC049044]|uniref:hypothetical protein n=1 Tax=Micromonospora sp. NPDC049044 TaxID=3154827 RepID=UPI0033F0F100
MLQVFRKSRILTSVAACLAVLALVLAGCEQVGPKSQKHEEDMTPIATQIQTQLAAEPGVTTAKVIYQNNLNAPGMVSVSLTAESGADMRTLVDAAGKLVWQSRLTPISTISIGVADPANPARGQAQDYNLVTGDDKAQLEQQWGPRPVK